MILVVHCIFKLLGIHAELMLMVSIASSDWKG